MQSNNSRQERSKAFYYLFRRALWLPVPSGMHSFAQLTIQGEALSNFHSAVASNLCLYCMDDSLSSMRGKQMFLKQHFSSRNHSDRINQKDEQHLIVFNPRCLVGIARHEINWTIFEALTDKNRSSAGSKL